jgi:hypothetical protein
MKVSHGLFGEADGEKGEMDLLAAFRRQLNHTPPIVTFTPRPLPSLCFFENSRIAVRWVSSSDAEVQRHPLQ